MTGYLNEQSISAYENLRNGLQLFWQAAVELNNVHADLYRNSSFFFDADFARRFNGLTFPTDPALKLPADLRSRLRELAFSDKYWKCWKRNPHSSEGEEYTCVFPHRSLRNDSLCEAAEVKLQQNNAAVGMLSAADSAFSGTPRLDVAKISSQQRAELRNADSLELVRRWIADVSDDYDVYSNVAPKDYQTILARDSIRFRRTDRFWNVAGKDRRIYKEIDSGRQFYVDEGHPGYSAHLEVFDSDGLHVGEANINTGNVDPSKRVEGRRITV